MPAHLTVKAPAKTISQLNPEYSLRSILRNAPASPAEKVRSLAALNGFGNQRGLLDALGIQNEVSLSRAINSNTSMGKAIRQRIADLFGLQVEDIWPADQAAA